MPKISAVINTRNEEKNLSRCLRTIYEVVDEIVIVDMESSDGTKKIAKQFDARIFTHKYTSYVEPARNFAIEKAKGDWVLLLDADELVSDQLLRKLINLAERGSYDFIRIPRKNIIFNKWIKHTGWWPDYQIRFFRKNAVTWGDEIHSIPITQGAGFDLLPEEKNAFTHHVYQTVSQFIERLNRYTTEEAKQKFEDNANFEWQDILQKPSGEFLSRFFLREGYKDGLHGLVLSLLQSFSMLVVELKVWEMHKFSNISAEKLLVEIERQRKEANRDFAYWFFNKKTQTATGLQRFIFKIRSYLRI